MKDPRAFEELKCFYDSLDAIPTPPLAFKRPNRWSFWSVLLAPMAASIVAYGFIWFCSSTPTRPPTSFPLRLSIDRMALDEIKAESPPRTAGAHVFKADSSRSIA